MSNKEYPDPWVSVNVHINKVTEEIHCDGDEGSVQFIKEKMYANGKIHDTLHSVNALDNLLLVAGKGTEQDLLEYVRTLIAEWGAKRSNLINTLCVVCGKPGHLNAKLVHKDCLENISNKSYATLGIMLSGNIVRLKRDLLGNPAGAFGVCYGTYHLGERQGSSFIFENGEYDGFSLKEQNKMLSLVGHSAELTHYQFTNAIQLSADFSAVDSEFKKTFEYINQLL